jgi:hypothetical protein
MEAEDMVEVVMEDSMVEEDSTVVLYLMVDSMEAMLLLEVL